MRYVPLLIAVLPLPLLSDETHLVDAYYWQGGVRYTNLSEQTLRCQISTKVDPNLPFGTLAEKRNIVLKPYHSYTYQRYPDQQIIYCEKEHARIDDQ